MTKLLIRQVNYMIKIVKDIFFDFYNACFNLKYEIIIIKIQLLKIDLKTVKTVKIIIFWNIWKKAKIFWFKFLNQWIIYYISLTILLIKWIHFWKADTYF